LPPQARLSRATTIPCHLVKRRTDFGLFNLKEEDGMAADAAKPWMQEKSGKGQDGKTRYRKLGRGSYTAHQFFETVTIRATGTLPNLQTEAQLVMSPIEIFPPEFISVLRRAADHQSRHPPLRRADNFLHDAGHHGGERPRCRWQA
jgi:hypothetical protein